MNLATSKEILLPMVIDDGRLDTLLEILALIKEHGSKIDLRLNWHKVSIISPAGFAILACLFDTAVEHQCKMTNLFVKKKFKDIAVIKNFLNLSNYKKLPDPQIHNFQSKETILSGNNAHINITFIENVMESFGNFLDEDLKFSCRLLHNELMQNTVDHASADRYYLYAGIYEKEIHIGILDMGVTIPAKLEQKYIYDNDKDYLTFALKKGSTTRRQRPGGFGLWHIFGLVKQYQGRLTLISRNAQIRRYFKNNKVYQEELKHRLDGTWCFARLPL